MTAPSTSTPAIQETGLKPAPTNGFRGAGLAARMRAAGVHLALSIAAVSLLAALMLWLWYPPAYFVADGGWRVLRIIVLVDVVIGPLLTFIVFNRAKPELKRDLAVIALIQLAAFGYGAATMYLYRSAFVTVAGNTAFTVNWRDLAAAGGDLSGAQALAAAAPAPVLVDLRMPATAAERAALWTEFSRGGRAPTHEAHRYITLTPERLDATLTSADDMAKLAKSDAGIAAELVKVHAAHPDKPPASLGFLPVTCRFDVVVLVFDRKSGRIIDWMN